MTFYASIHSMIYDKNRPGPLGEAIDRFDTPETNFLDKRTGNYLRGLNVNVERARHRGRNALLLAGVLVAGGIGINELGSVMANESMHEPGQTYLKYQQEQQQTQSLRTEEVSRPQEEHVLVPVTTSGSAK